MKIKTYIKKCNMKQLAQFLESVYWCDQTIKTVFEHDTIEEHAKYLHDVIFQQELPPMIQFGNNSYIDTKTRKVKKYF